MGFENQDVGINTRERELNGSSEDQSFSAQMAAVLKPDWLEGLDNKLGARQQQGDKQLGDMFIAFNGPEAQKEKTYTKEDLEKLGPRAADFVKALGIESLKIESTPNGDQLTLKLKDVVKRDPEEGDEFDRLFFQKDVSAIITRQPDGTIVLDKIKGMTAETDVPFVGTFTGRIHHMEIREVDGKTEIKSTATVKKFGRDREHEGKPKIAPPEYKQKAELLLDKLGIKKK